jgi:dolichol kinase
MLLRPIAACVIIAAILGLSEVLWRAKIIKGEIARKLIHIAAGSFIAFLPFWMDYGYIVVLALGFIVVNIVNHYEHVFHSIFSVKRRSVGDILFSVAILLCAIVGPDKWIFAAAILHVSLADGLAAVVGTYLGHYHGQFYRILRHQKSVIGSAAFMLISFFLIATAVVMGQGFVADAATIVMLLVLPIFTTVAEGVGIYGIDNLLLPMMVLFALQSIQI